MSEIKISATGNDERGQGIHQNKKAITSVVFFC